MSAGASVVANNAIVLYKNIAFAGEPLDDCHALICLEIDGERALGVVDADGMRGVMTRRHAELPAGTGATVRHTQICFPRGTRGTKGSVQRGTQRGIKEDKGVYHRNGG